MTASSACAEARRWPLSKDHEACPDKQRQEAEQFACKSEVAEPSRIGALFATSGPERVRDTEKRDRTRATERVRERDKRERERERERDRERKRERGSERQTSRDPELAGSQRKREGVIEAKSSRQELGTVPCAAQIFAGSVCKEFVKKKRKASDSDGDAVDLYHDAPRKIRSLDTLSSLSSYTVASSTSASSKLSQPVHG